MRIAIVHNFYSSRVPSGENQMVRQQYEALRQDGHLVRLFSYDNDVSINDFLDKLQAGVTTSTAFGRSPQKEIDTFSPDIIFVNNLFPNIGSRWLKNLEVPVVAILHNYRYFCATGLNFRDNKQCFDCVEKSPLEGLRHKCYRDSFFATLPLTIAQVRRNLFYDELEEFDEFIALSKGSRDILVGAGLPNEKTIVIPNFIEDFMRSDMIRRPEKEKKWICVGRITVDKGFLNLVENWPDHVRLDIVGDGPEMQEMAKRSENKSNIRILGNLDRDLILKTLPEYSGAIHPSLWPEVCPLTVIEFLCAGLPVITLDSNTSAITLVESDSGIALKSFSKDNLRVALDRVQDNYEAFSYNARQVYLKHYTKNSWLASINSLMDRTVDTYN